MVSKPSAPTEELVHPTVVAAAVQALSAFDPLPIADLLPGQPVPRPLKIAILQRLLDAGGVDAVLTAGQRLREAPEDPLLAVLLNSDSVAVLLEKLEALNRYFHSNHRHAVVEVGDTALKLDHVAVSGDPPLLIESLFTCGLYIALLEEIGCQGLTCAFRLADGSEAAVWRDHLPQKPPLTDTANWTFHWRDLTPRRPLPGVDALVMRNLPPDLSRGDDLTVRVRAILIADPARKWRIPDVARHAAISARSLQRHLRDEGTTFSRLLTDTRVGHAKTLLGGSGESITTVGYVCGFADTAHFTRTFRSATGRTPSAWRESRAVAADR